MQKTHPNQPSSIFIWNGIAYQKLAYSDILWIEKHQGKTRLVSIQHHFHLNISLKKLQQLFPFQELQQVHRSYIININWIDNIEYRKVFIRQKEIPIGSTFWKGFKSQYVFKRGIVLLTKN